MVYLTVNGISGLAGNAVGSFDQRMDMLLPNVLLLSTLNC